MDPNQENQGENSAGGSRQAIFTPQPPVVEGEAPTIPASAQASDGSSIHPYFSSHPTQTFNTEVGDIILNTSAPKPKQNKRPFIIGGIILVIFAVVCVVVLLISSLFTNSDRQVLALLQNNYEVVNWVENFFADTYYNKLDINEVFTAELHEKLNNSISTLSALQKSLAKINSSSLSSNAQQNFNLLQSRLNERIPNYQSSVVLYNSLYKAYTNSNPGVLKDLLLNENYYANLATERMYNYLTEQEKLWGDIRNNNCDSNENSSEFCQRTLEEYFNNMAELSSSTLVVAAIFTAYYDGSYTEDNRLMPNVDILLEELK